MNNKFTKEVKVTRKNGIVNKNFMNNNDKDYKEKLQKRIYNETLRLKGADKSNETISLSLSITSTNSGSNAAPVTHASTTVTRRHGTIEYYLPAYPTSARAGQKQKQCKTMETNHSESEHVHVPDTIAVTVGDTVPHPNLTQNYEYMLRLCKSFFNNYWKNGQDGINAMKYGTIIYEKPLYSKY